MLNLKKIAVIGASALALTTAAGVSAQAQPRFDHRPTYEAGRLTSSYVDSLDWKIQRAAQNRLISWGEARELKAQLHDVQPLAFRVQNGQASDWEFRRLDRTVSRIENAINRYAANDRYDRRYYRR